MSRQTQEEGIMVDGHTTTIDDVDPLTEYSVMVAGVNSKGTGHFSEPVTVVTHQPMSGPIQSSKPVTVVTHKGPSQSSEPVTMVTHGGKSVLCIMHIVFNALLSILVEGSSAGSQLGMYNNSLLIIYIHNNVFYMHKAVVIGGAAASGSIIIILVILFVVVILLIK